MTGQKKGNLRPNYNTRKMAERPRTWMRQKKFVTYENGGLRDKGEVIKQDPVAEKEEQF